ncbi:MAG: phosphoglucomutase/phosphomannomutase family protein [Limnochordia bacterium]|jgi:phosphomannomutase|nr:phosphoglucomutase/phosphomannomutase family protein [Limnochordia bacterium]
MVKFGTGGWRAIIAEEFTFGNVRRVAQAVALYLEELGQAHKPVVVGHDLRFLSGRFSRALAEILVHNGITVWFIEQVVPTPMLMYAVDQEGLAMGLMVTASHNPSEYNGLKIIVEGGKDAQVEVTNRLEEICRTIPDLQAPPLSFDAALLQGKIIEYSNKNAYIDSLLAQIDIEAVQKRNFRVLFNPMFGVAKDIMAMCLASLRCSVDLINADRDTMFGQRAPTPARESLQDMEYMMKQGKYHIGIATDGDSDRIGLYDEQGNYIDANEILKLLYYYLKAYRNEKGGLVRNVTTSHVLDRIAHSFGEPAYEVPVGFKHISSKMDEENLLLGGESSGGLKIRGHVNGKDGILAALLAVEMLAKTGKSLSQLLAEINEKYGTLYFGEVNLHYNPQDRTRLNQILIQERYTPTLPWTLAKTSYADGVKFYFTNDNWFSVRFSGTEPILRLAYETASPKEGAQLKAAVFSDTYLSLPSPEGEI